MISFEIRLDPEVSPVYRYVVRLDPDFEAQLINGYDTQMLFMPSAACRTRMILVLVLDSRYCTGTVRVQILHFLLYRVQCFISPY